MARRLLPFLALLLLAGCEESTISFVAEVCTPIIDSLEPAAGPAAGGTDVLLSGLFVSTNLGERDVLVHLGGAEAEVTGVFRGDACDTCDACIAEALRCGECERECRGTLPFTAEDETQYPAQSCEEWVSFLTPAHEAGEAELILTNARGSAGDVYFDFEADDDSADDDDSAP